VPDIHHELPIDAPADRVFPAFITPDGLDVWWTKSSAGQPVVGGEYRLGFGPGYTWHARVTRLRPDSEFELELTEADRDWTGTRVGVQLEPRNGRTYVRFHHTGWPDDNEHYRVSCTCWAMYLRLLRRFIERGEQVPYEDRLDA
jgi:uncharacterized protein YndB with AHSA1/START domain